MRLLTALLCSFFLFAACTADAASKVAGTYTVEFDTSGMPEEAAEAMREMMKPGECVIRADGTWESSMERMGQKSTVKGTWTLEGDTISMTSAEQDGQKSEQPQTATGKVEGDTVILTMPAQGQEMKMIMTRKAE